MENSGFKNGCQLITYPDSLGGSLKALERILKNQFAGVIDGVHILPFYPSSADRGFAPLTYYEVDPGYGTWKDVENISSSFDLVADFMLNHISRQSCYFKDFLKRKDTSPYADIFIRYKDFWPGGEPSPGDLERIYTRKPRPPFLEVTFKDGTREKIWCTFDYEQIDLNLESRSTRALIAAFIRFLCEKGAKIIRLDAFAYSTKKPGTDCFFVEPEVWEYLDFVRSITEDYGAEILPEVHEHYTIQLKLAERGFMVYDFALPMLVLQALYDGDGRRLKHWLSICPQKQITTLDTHDGIGVVDVEDLLSKEEINRTKENLFTKGANVKKIYNTREYNNLDIYQINCTYYSALGNRDDLYLLARAIQFFSPGIPQVYYVGLLAGENDIELLEKTKEGRNINRHNYSEDEIAKETERPVVQKLLKLMRFRNTHPAFQGKPVVHKSPPETLIISWTKGGDSATLSADLREGAFTIESTGTENGYTHNSR